MTGSQEKSAGISVIQIMVFRRIHIGIAAVRKPLFVSRIVELKIS